MHIFIKSDSICAMYFAQIKLDGLPKLINATSFNNWRVVYGERKKWKERVAKCFISDAPKSPLKKAQITCIRYSSRQSDYDGLVSSFKACIDGLKLAKVIEDDNPNVIGMPIFLWKKAPPKLGFIEIIVKEILE